MADTQFKFALFPDLLRARRAKRELEARTDAHARVVDGPEGLEPRRLPIQLTHVRVGAIVGGVAVGITVIGVLVAIVLLDLEHLPQPVASPLVSIAVITFLAAILGGLAGALSLTTEARREVEHLRELLQRSQQLPPEQRPTVLLIEEGQPEPLAVEQLLIHEGATETGRLT